MAWITETWEWFEKLMQKSPELAIFLTLALGFFVGKLKFKSFSLGNVTSVLLMGVIIGQMNIHIDPVVKSTFFLIFLFAVGYSVGPQFVQSLRKEGLPQILFATIVCIFCLIVPLLCAWIVGFDLGNAVGLMSGGNTISAVIGVAGDTINQLSINDASKQKFINEIPVAYAVTYIFGTAGTAWFLASVGPKILVGKGDIVKMSKDYEDSLGGSIHSNELSEEEAYNGATFRVFKLNSKYFTESKTVQEFENMLVKRGWPLYVERIRNTKGEIIKEFTADQILNPNDLVVLNGPVDSILKDENCIGNEVVDLELLDFHVEVLKVIVANKKVSGKTLEKIKFDKNRHGVIIRKIMRGKAEIPLLNNVKIVKGDVVELEGRKVDVERFASYLGFAEKPTQATDLLYVGLGIFVGGILGSLTVKTGNVPLSLSASGGVLIMGIIFGWLRSKKPTFGAVPEASIWLMNNLGLNAFIAIVGISAGPDFIAGIKTSGLSLFIAGIFVSIVPMFIGLIMGKYIFKFHPTITLGACAGARTTTAALGAIQDATKSKVAALSYTTTYAIGNTLLIVWGVVMVILLNIK
jgi:putative transport protein